MNKLFSILAVLSIQNVAAADWVNYCIGGFRLGFLKSQMRVTCNKSARRISGGHCIYFVDNECFTFEGWDNHGSKFCLNQSDGLTETDLTNGNQYNWHVCNGGENVFNEV